MTAVLSGAQTDLVIPAQLFVVAIVGLLAASYVVDLATAELRRRRAARIRP